MKGEELDIHLTPKQPTLRDPKETLTLKRITGRDLMVYEVERDCSLEEFQFGDNRPPNSSGKHLKGSTFYELTDKKEDIYDGQEIILQKKV